MHKDNIYLIFIIGVMSMITPLVSGDANMTVLEQIFPAANHDSLNAAVKDQLENPETINKNLYYLIVNSGWNVLKNLNIKFKTFNSTRDSARTAFGFSYVYAKDLKNLSVTDEIGVSVLSLDANGNVAFDEETSPNDFLDSKVSLHIYGSHGGTVDADDDTSYIDSLYSLIQELADVENVKQSPLWESAFNLVQGHTSTQFYWQGSLKGGLESDQSFDKKQYAYGLQLGMDIKAWNWNSALARFNVFDWPFSLIRILSGYDKKLCPRGYAIPIVLIGLDQVNPVNDSLRIAVSSGSVYPRFRTEISFKTPLNATSNLVANFRYYKEINASAAIKTANIDEFMYFTCAVTMSNGMYVSYTTGKLPFDARNDQVYEFGFQYNFD